MKKFSLKFIQLNLFLKSKDLCLGKKSYYVGSRNLEYSGCFRVPIDEKTVQDYKVEQVLIKDY
jgi:hypothetical protein